MTQHPPPSATGHMGAERQAIVDAVAHHWSDTDGDWDRFVQAVNEATTDDGVVDPNEVRRLLTDEDGLTMNPRRLSAFWNRANSFLKVSGWTENLDVAGGNAGKPLRLRVWRTEITS